MFDEILFEMPCPECGHILKGFQSKDGPCSLQTLEFWQVDNFYDKCSKCGLWVEFTAKKKKKRQITEYKMYTRKSGEDKLQEGVFAELD